MSNPSSHPPRLLGALAAALGLGLSCAAPKPPATNVLLVTIDTLRGDRWGCLGDPDARSPVADRIARGGLLAFEGRAPAPLTLPSHASMMTGLTPAQHGVRDNGIFALAPDRGITIAEALRAEGWTTAAFVSAFPLARRFGVDRGFDVYDEFLGGGESEGTGGLRERTAGETVERVQRWLERRPPDPKRPVFAWVHFFDPHANYTAPAVWNAALGGRAYDAEVAFVDHELGRLVRLLEIARGRFRLAIASDHGESLGEHGEDTHGVLLHAATIRVPIVLRADGYVPRLRARPVPLESIARSVLDLAGSQAALDPAAADAVMRFEGPTHAETLYPALNFGWRALRAREADGWKLIAGAAEKLYRTSDDPGETSNLAASRPDEVRSLREALEAAFAAASAATPRDASAEDTEALRSLGYLSAGGTEAPKIAAAFTHGTDPTEKIHLLRLINLGISRLDGGHAADAESALAQVVEEDPSNRLALEFLGRSQLRQGRAVEARNTLRRAVAKGLNPTPVYLDLARAEREAGDGEGERLVLENALALDPRSMAIRIALARHFAERGRIDQAIALLEEARRRHPKAAEPCVALAQIYGHQGRRKDAEELWRRVLELDPDGPAGTIARAALDPAKTPKRQS